MKTVKILLYIAAFALLAAAGVWAGTRDGGSAAPTEAPLAEIPELTAAPTKEIIFTGSAVDFDSDGVDDYTDILTGAKAEAERHPYYDERYWPDTNYSNQADAQLEGYPPDDVGVCTDVIWRAFRDAGYNLKKMISADIRRFPDEYELVGAQFDGNIDFRFSEVQNLFFSFYAVSLTTDTADVYAWQAGDIVTYDGHIGIVSDIRRADGLPYLIHNTDILLTGSMEEDALDSREIIAHYRWDASLIAAEILFAWSE